MLRDNYDTMDNMTKCREMQLEFVRLSLAENSFIQQIHEMLHMLSTDLGTHR